MKNFEEWQRERKAEGDKIGKINCVLSVLGCAAFLLAIYLPAPLWIPTAIIWAQLPLSVGLTISQQRKFAAQAKAEKLEMEQRHAREDMELNATILMPHNVEAR